MPDDFAGLSIVIPACNEDKLTFTVKRALETRQGVTLDIIAVEDGGDRKYDDWPETLPNACRIAFLRNRQRVGLCYSRDVGIQRARFRPVLVLDAHSNFLEDDGWARFCVDYCREHPRHVGCAISVQLRPESMDMHHDPTRDMQPPACYYGARILSHQTDSNRRRIIFPSKWDGSGKDRALGGDAAVIQSVLGGAYLLDREWYMTGLCRPWRYLRGWGTSEQNLSIPNWLLGGENVLLPLKVGHMYRTGRCALVPYRTELGDIMYNQLRLAHVLPLDADLRRRMENFVFSNHCLPGDRNRVRRWFDLMPPADYRAYLETAPRSWTEYVERWQMTLEVPG